MIETFQLIFEGQRFGAYKELPIEKHLTLLKFSDNAIAKLASGKHVALKKKLSYEDADLQQQKFKSAGLVTTIKIELNADLFKLGLKSKLPNPQPATSPKQQPSIVSEINSESNSNHETPVNIKQANGTVHIINPKATIPTIFSSPGDYPIKDTSNHNRLKLKNDSYSIRGFLLIAISAGIGLTLQTYILALILNFGFPNILTTLLGIAFLLFCVACFPKIFQPLQYCELTLKDEVIKLIDQFNLMPSKHRITWAIESKGSQGTISLHSNSASIYNGSASYHWDAKLRTEFAGEGSIADMQEQFIDGTIVGTILTTINQFKKVLSLLKPVKSNNVDWDNMPSTFISNQDDHIVALIYSTPKQAYRIVDPSFENDLLLHAFCVSVHRVRMI